MAKTIQILAATACFALMASWTAVALDADFGPLMARIPGGTNTLVILNVDRIIGSPLAKKDKWQERRDNAFAAGLSILPPDAERFVMAANMDFDFMQPTWTVTLVKIPKKRALSEIAARWGGEMDRISSRDAVKLPDDSYLIPFGENMLGAYHPGNRQRVASWLRQTDRSGDRLSPYIEKAVGFAEKNGTPIIMAMDFDNVISLNEVQKRLETFEALKDKDIDLTRLATSLSKMKGITLGVTVKDRVHGALVIDFDDDISFIGELAKPMVLEALAKNSAMIHEFEDWKCQVEGKRIRLSGYFGRSGLKRVLSILDAPPVLQEHLHDSPGAEPDEESLKRLASQQYFNSVTGDVDDLTKKPKGKDSVTQS